MGNEADGVAKTYGNIIKAFLLDPADRQAFDAFYSFCLLHTITYLRYLKAHGYKISSDQSPAEKEVADTAIDVLGAFLARGTSGRYHVIDEYFCQKGVDDYAEAAPAFLFTLFSILLRGFVKREISHIRSEAEPQKHNLKRRFSKILTPPEYDSFEEAGQKVFVFRVEYKDNLRSEQDILNGERLHALVHESYLCSMNRTRWCRRIFVTLNDRPGYRNILNKHELVSSAVTVNVSLIEISAWRPQHETPDWAYTRRGMESAVEKALLFVRQTSLARFISQGRINNTLADKILAAVENMLRDKVNGGATEKLPVYFGEQCPGIDSSEYQKTYKYIVDTVAAQAVEEFIGLCRE